MIKNARLFLLSAVLALFFLAEITIFQEKIENAIYCRNLAENPPAFFIAQITKNFPMLKMSAEAAISLQIDNSTDGDASQKIIFKKNENQKMPIASLTKLLTGTIASEFFQPETKIRISRQAVEQPEETGNLKIGESLPVKDLLAIALIESSNDAAFALAEQVGVRAFTALMNIRASQLKMADSFFFDPTGLDPETSSTEEMNYSTASDLTKLAQYVLKNPLILELTSQKEKMIYLENGLARYLKNTNELLGKIPAIIGGKTGYTEKAGGCLVLILKCQQPGAYLINVILNSKERFLDMENLTIYANSRVQCY